jgi:hypothetical protein
MNLLDENGILDLRNYNKDFKWKEHEDIIGNIKGFNVKGFKRNIDFEKCKLFNESGIDFLDLSNFKGGYINFEKSNISFKQINVKNSLGEISFYGCNNLNDIDFLDLSEFKGKYINFTISSISFKQINVKNSLGKISFYECNNLNDIDYLDLSEFKGIKIDFSWSVIFFKKISVKNSLGELRFYGSKFLKKIEYLDLSEFKGDKIYFWNSNIDFKNINLYNNKSILYFNYLNKINKKLRKKFDLSKGIDSNENIILFKYHTKNDLLKLYKDGLINLTKLKHQTELKDIYNFLKTHFNDFNLFESLISFKSF